MPAVRETVRGGTSGRRLVHAAVAAASSLLLACSFHPVDLPWVAFVGLVPWLVLLTLRGPRGAVLAAVAGGFAYSFYVLAWAGTVSWLGVVVLSAASAAYGLPTGLLLSHLHHRRGLPLPLAAPLVFTAVDFLRELTTGGISWLSIGYSQFRLTTLIQVADATRVFGVSFLVLLVNGVLAEAVAAVLGPRTEGARRLSRAAVSGAAAVLLIGACLGYGAWRRATVHQRPGPLLAGVQANVPQREKRRLGPLAAATTVLRTARLTGEALDAGTTPPALLVWPETTFELVLPAEGPRVPQVRDALRRRTFASDPRFTLGELLPGAAGEPWVDSRDFAAWAFRRDVPVPRRASPPLPDGLRWILGAGTVTRLVPGDPDDDADRATSFNSALFLERDLSGIDIYDKVEIVPFGEFVPFRWLPYRDRLLSFIHRTQGFIPALRAGTDLKIWNLHPAFGGAPFGITNCFEVVFPALHRTLVSRGASFFVNVSNDGWYDDSAELDLVNGAQRFRAIETRRSQFRVATTGISALVDPTGREIAVVADGGGRRKEVAGILRAEAPLADAVSPYVRHGDIFGYALLGAVLAALVVPWRRRGDG